MTLLEMSLTGGAMIALVIILRVLLIDRLPKRTFVCLWSLALMRLMLPFSIPVALPWAGPPDAGALPVAQVRTLAQSAVPGHNPWPGLAGPLPAWDFAADIGPWPTAQHIDPATPAPKPMDWLLPGYCAGAALVALYLLSAYVALRREFKKARQLTDGPAVAFVKARNLARQVRVLASDKIKSPIAYGLIRPCILLPESMVDDEAQLPYVLTHELIHIRRLDAPMKLAFAACLCLHWFNPLVWAMYILYNRDVELACDQRVVRELGADCRALYATLLLNMQEGRNGLMPLCNSFSRYSLKERIVSISKYKKTSALAMVLALALVTVVGTAFATRAEQAPAQSGATAQHMAVPPPQPAPTPGAAWLDQNWDETGYMAVDPRVAQLMALNWPNMSVAQFWQQVRRAIDTPVDGMKLDFRALYGTYRDEDKAAVEFIFGPLQRAMLELGEMDGDETLWHPGDPRGIQAFAINPGMEAYQDGEPYVLVDYLLTCDTLQPDAITVAQREAQLAGYRARMSDWLGQRQMSELVQGDALALIRAQRDLMDAQFATKQLRIRGINFQGRYFDGSKLYATPGDFVDNMEYPPNDPPVVNLHIEEHYYSSLTKIRVGTIYAYTYDEDMGETTRQATDHFVSMGGRDQPWHNNGWRDPATGLSVKFFPDVGWPLISPDNGMSWWRENIPSDVPDGSVEYRCVINAYDSYDLSNWTLWYTPTGGWRMSQM